MNQITDMTTGSPVRHLLRFAFPLFLTNFGQQLYMIADGAIVGRGVGMKALAAVGATDWTYWLILWTIEGLTQGFSTFISRDFGHRNYREMNKTIASSIVLSAAIGGFLCALGLIISRPALLLLNTPQDILGDAVTYLRTMICGTVIVMAYNMSASILRALGNGRAPLVAMVIAALLNIGLDLLFVFVFHWGILGAAAASVIAQFVSFLYCLACLRKIDCIRLERSFFRPDWARARKMLLFGIPVALQHITVALGGIFLQSSVNLQGSVFIAGYTATNKVYGLLECSALSLGLACSTFFAQNYGAGNYARVKKSVGIAALIVVILSLIVTVLTVAGKELLMRLFIDTNEPGGADALAVSLRYISTLASCLPVLFLIHVFRNALQAMGISIWSFISGVAELLVRASMAKLAIRLLGSSALFTCEPIAWFFSLLCVMLPYFYYQKRRLPTPQEKAVL